MVKSVLRGFNPQWIERQHNKVWPLSSFYMYYPNRLRWYFKTKESHLDSLRIKVGKKYLCRWCAGKNCKYPIATGDDLLEHVTEICKAQNRYAFLSENQYRKQRGLPHNPDADNLTDDESTGQEEYSLSDVEEDQQDSNANQVHVVDFFNDQGNKESSSQVFDDVYEHLNTFNANQRILNQNAFGVNLGMLNHNAFDLDQRTLNRNVFNVDQRTLNRNVFNVDQRASNQNLFNLDQKALNENVFNADQRILNSSVIGASQSALNLNGIQTTDQNRASDNNNLLQELLLDGNFELTRLDNGAQEFILITRPSVKDRSSNVDFDGSIGERSDAFKPNNNFNRSINEPLDLSTKKRRQPQKNRVDKKKKTPLVVDCVRESNGDRTIINLIAR